MDIVLLIIAIAFPVFIVGGWTINIILNYKGSLKERLKEWYHEGDTDL